MKHIATALQVVSILLSAVIPSIVHADGIGDPIPSYYQEAGLAPNRDYENQHPEEHIDPFTGKLQWHYVDLFIPGNGGFDLKVQRSYSSLGDSPPEATAFGAGWTVHFGRLLTADPFDICMNGGTTVLELPDGSRQILYRATAWPTTMTLVTTNYWASLCTANGLVVYAVDGRYDRGVVYDGIDRPTVINGPWGPGTVTYDGHDNIRNMGMGNATLGYTYDTTTDLLTSVSGSRAYAFTYDVYGNVTSNGSTTFGYDDASVMRCAKCGQLDQITYDYDGLNQRVRTQQNGLTTYFITDSTGKLLWEQTPGVGIKEYVYVDGKQVAVRQQTP